MPYEVSIEGAKTLYPDYVFIAPLTPSEQKAAFHVRDKSGQDLCLKLIAPDYDLDRLKREIDALRKLNHPNVARLVEYVFASSASQQKHHIVEEFISGSDLSASLENGAPWYIKEAAAFCRDLANGLEQLRIIKVVHRDLKPSNIRRREDGSPVIIDFGLARHLELPDLTRTADGAEIGTPVYFAPEQFEGTKHDIDHRTDLFAFGILCYFALIGRHPFLGASPLTYGVVRLSICESNTWQEDERFQALPPNWQIILKKLLAKSRGDRPHSAGLVANLLDKIAR